ncbi:Hypothetical protein NTJ_12253 [Nesidiocoris tenuis]|uniref:Uncharacterized protein n=1 Tax=Nesidiocoris tenuis TaxID=355587 RepID=A0ABN7B8E8_9HEMI|nr:Hypothetical protein NTJ_12253 [Nesidiocoris tenuis]
MLLLFGLLVSLRLIAALYITVPEEALKPHKPITTKLPPYPSIKYRTDSIKYLHTEAPAYMGLLGMEAMSPHLSRWYEKMKQIGQLGDEPSARHFFER